MLSATTPNPGRPTGVGSETPKIELRGVGKSYTRRKGGQTTTVQALRDTNLSIRSGEFVSLIGPSGCGKTTLLKCIDGLSAISEGDILVDGRSVRAPGRDRAFVFQNFGLFPWRTAAANVEFPLEVLGAPPAERRPIVKRLIEMVGLARFDNHHPHELSGGMQQRVGLARALAVDPQVLLMDEPFGALDAQTRELMQIELLKIWSATKKTAVFVTHSVDEAIFLSDRIAVFSASPGTIVEVLDVQLPHPRWEFDVKAAPHFHELRSRIWDLLRPVAGDHAPGGYSE